jgi:hypothetical protein
VEVPAQVVDQRGSLAHEPVAMVDELADLQRLLIELRDGELLEALSERGAGDRQRVGGIGFPRLAGAVARPGRQFGRDSEDPLAAAEQEPLQAPGHVPAVLDRPHPL